VFLLPLVCSTTAQDAFRYPKQLFFRATAFVILAIFATAAVWGGIQWTAIVRKRSVGILIGLIAIWAVVTTMRSTNLMLSLGALEYTAEAILFFGAAWIAVTGRRIEQLVIPALAGGIINALLAITQATDFWNPFTFGPDLTAHLKTSALLGNANDVGAYLMLLSIASTAVALVRKGWVWPLMTAVLIAGLMASQSLAAIGAYVVAVMVMTFLASRRTGWAIIGAAFLATLLAFALLPPLRARVALIDRAIDTGDWPTATSGRLFPIAAAWDMFKDHPVTGVGPGTFKFHFLEYRMKLNERDPRWFYFSAQNFAEVHSDHMQVLAEEGLPGFLLLAASLVMLANASRNRRHDDEREAFVHYTGLGLAAGLATLAIASFPLEMVAVMQTMSYLAAAVLNWSARP